MKITQYAALALAALATGRAAPTTVVDAPVTALDTAYMPDGTATNVVFPDDLNVAGNVLVNRLETDLRTAKVEGSLTAISLDAATVQVKRAVALDTKARRIRSPNGKVVVKGTIQVAGAIRYTMPNTDDFPAAIPGESFLELEDAAVPPAKGRYWKRVAKEDFSVDSATNGWDALLLHGGSILPQAGAERAACGDHAGANHFLAGRCQHDMVKTFPIKDRHSEVRVKAKFHFIDAWKGEGAYMKVDNGYAWLTSFTSPKTGVNMCGREDAKESKMGVPIDVITEHTGDVLELKFGSELGLGSGQRSCEGMFGVDDIEVFIR